MRCALLDANGAPLPDYTLEECDEIYGNELTRIVRWKKGTDLSALAAQTVRLQIALRDADLYSFRFK